ncbi:MAG: hypothetical protein AMJ67_14770 [Betaproteobacteria bacterium SG8_41]|nr:MAG: hypothetical protein AMJ67_14770 [Betaproteobacteria bacterium SG8_41]
MLWEAASRGLVSSDSKKIAADGIAAKSEDAFELVPDERVSKLAEGSQRELIFNVVTDERRTVFIVELVTMRPTAVRAADLLVDESEGWIPHGYQRGPGERHAIQTEPITNLCAGLQSDGSGRQDFKAKVRRCNALEIERIVTRSRLNASAKNGKTSSRGSGSRIVNSSVCAIAKFLDD